MKRIFKKAAVLALFAGVSLSLGGCAAPIGMTLFGIGSGLSAGTTLDHNLSGIAYKTFTAPLDDVKVATRLTLERMAIEISEEERNDEYHLIVAKTENRKIDVELEPLSDQTTRMRVVASQNFFLLKDRATATEIISQTARTMDRLDQAKLESEFRKTAAMKKPEAKSQKPATDQVVWKTKEGVTDNEKQGGS